MDGSGARRSLLAVAVSLGVRRGRSAQPRVHRGPVCGAGDHVPLDAAGDLRLRAAYNNTRTKIVGSIATPPQLAGFESVLFDHIEQNRLECAQPRDSLRLQSVWQRSRVGVNLDVARYGEFCSFVTTNPADDQTFSPKWLTNVEAAYRTSRYLLAAGALNLFNVFPDRNSTVNSFNGIQTFPSQSPFGMNGRGLYARIGYSF